MAGIRRNDPAYAQQLAALRATMPEDGSERIRWYRQHRAERRADLRLLWHAYCGTRDEWDDEILEAPDSEYLRDIQPGWMWVRIDHNSRKNYVTSGYALNLSDPGGEIGAADWHVGCWQTQLRGVHPRSRDCLAARYTPLRGQRYFAETWASLGDAGIVDVRTPLHEIGHPAGNRDAPVWAANHSRAIIDKAWDSLRSGATVWKRVTPYDVARWLWTDEQFGELFDMARCIESGATLDDARMWRMWTERLSPDAHWRDVPATPAPDVGRQRHATTY